MIPITVPGFPSLASVVMTVVIAVVPAAIAWWNDRRLVGKADDPALPEMLADRRRRNVRVIAIGIAVMIVLGGASAAWGIPLLIVLLIAASYPLRTRLLGETWGFGAYLRHTLASATAGFGFWIALCYLPGGVAWVVERAGTGRLWMAVVVSLAGVAALFAWEAWYPRLWIRAHAGVRLTSPELTPRFDEIVRKAGTVVPAVYRVGPQGSRFVNAMALPSVRRPTVALGNALLELLDADETVAIFAHEIAHFDHFTPRRIRRAQLLNRLLIVVGAALPLVAAFAREPWSPWIGWVWPFVVIVALGRRAAKSQQHETESDLRAAALSGDPEALVRGLVKLHLHARIPRRYAVDIERAASHPSLVRRIQAIRSDGPAAIEQLGAATVVRSTREGSWVVLDATRSYWLDGVPGGTEPQLAALRDAASSYRAVNYRDLVELRVAANGEARTIAARTGRGDRWSVPIAAEDVARVQRALDVVDLQLGKAGPAVPQRAPKAVALAAFVVAFISGQAGIVLAPILVALAKPSAAALAAIGAMSIVRAVLGAVGGSNWFDEHLAQIGLVTLAVVGVFAIVTAVRLVRAGEAKAHRTLTLSVLVGVAAVVGVVLVMRSVQEPSAQVVGSPLLGTFATALAGIAAALFTVEARWGRPAAYAGVAAVALVAALGIDRAAWRLRHALTEDAAAATLLTQTDLSMEAHRLRASPDGSHFLAMRMVAEGQRRVPATSGLVTGRLGLPAREVAGVDGDFIDSARVLIADVIDSGVTLRIGNVDGGDTLVWADTIRGVRIEDPSLVVDRAMQVWAIYGTEADSDHIAVFGGRIGVKGATRGVALGDTLPVMGSLMVFDSGSTVVVPTYQRLPSRRRAGGLGLSLWWLPLFGFEGPDTELWRVHGDTVGVLLPIRGILQCGEPRRGSAMCVVQRPGGASLYAVSATSASEVARLSSQENRFMAPGPGLEGASMAIDRRTMAVVNLVTRRLTRVSLPPSSEFAIEARTGPGWLVTLGITPDRRSTVRLYRVGTSQR